MGWVESTHEYHQEFGYQEYIGWVKEDLKISGQMGKNLLNVQKQFGDRTNFVLNDIAPSALYLLSAPSTPDSARDVVIRNSMKILILLTILLILTRV